MGGDIQLLRKLWFFKIGLGSDWRWLVTGFTMEMAKQFFEPVLKKVIITEINE
jgi:hypothetical protein